jgi:hypothetical protein
VNLLPHKSKWADEVDNLKKLGEQGKTMQQIADLYGCSRQRIKQVIERHIPEWHLLYGKAVRDSKAQKEFEHLIQWRTRKWGTPNRSKVTSDLYWIQRQKFFNKRANAKRIGAVWELEFGDITWPTHCPILGMEIDYYSEGRSEASPSFDQIVPGKGYVLGNVQVISWKANRLKNDGSWQDHQMIADFMRKLEESSGN